MASGGGNYVAHISGVCLTTGLTDLHLLASIHDRLIQLLMGDRPVMSKRINCMRSEVRGFNRLYLLFSVPPVASMDLTWSVTFTNVHDEVELRMRPVLETCTCRASSHADHWTSSKCALRLACLEQTRELQMAAAAAHCLILRG